MIPFLLGFLPFVFLTIYSLHSTKKERDLVNRQLREKEIAEQIALRFQLDSHKDAYRDK